MAFLAPLIFGYRTVQINGTALPTETILNLTGSVTGSDDPTNGRSTIVLSSSGSVTLAGDVHGPSGANYVSALSGASAGFSTINLPTGNNLALSGSDTNIIIDTTFPGFICLGAEDGSGTDGMQIAAANQIFLGSTAGGAAGEATLFGQYIFFGDETQLSGGDANLRMEFGGGVTKLAAREDRGITSLKIGFLGANTTAAAADAHYYAQDGNATNPNGGTTFFYGGAKSGSGLKGGVALAVNGVGSEIMASVGEVLAGQRVLSLVRGSALTSTQMPASTGDRVIYIANAASNPTASPNAGAILYASGGVLNVRQSDGTTFPIASAGAIPISGTPAIGNQPVATSTSAAAWAALNLAGGSGYVAGVLPTGNQASQTMAGDVTGTTATAAVVALTGSVGNMDMKGSSVTWRTGQTPLLTESTPTTDTLPANFTIQAQYPFASATGANRKPGDVVVDVGVPTNSGTTEGTFEVTRNGSRIANIGVAGNATSFHCFWLGGDPATGNSTAILESDGSSFSYLQTPSGACGISIGGTLYAYVTTDAFRFGGNGTNGIGGANGVLSINNVTTAPTSSPTGGGILYSESGAGKWCGTSGTITTFGPAEPHCEQCGADFMTEHESPKYGYLAICLKCMADELGERKWIKRSKPCPA